MLKPPRTYNDKTTAYNAKTTAYNAKTTCSAYDETADYRDI